MSEPRYRCARCGRTQTVHPDGRGFPPDIAKRRLVKRCKAEGCPSEPEYTAGVGLALELLLAGEDS